MCCLYQLLAPCLGFNPYTKAPDAAPIQSSNSLSCPTMRSAAVDCGCTAFSPRGGFSSGSLPLTLTRIRPPPAPPAQDVGRGVPAAPHLVGQGVAMQDDRRDVQQRQLQVGHVGTPCIDVN